MRIKKYHQYNEELTTSKDYKCPICGSEVYVTHGGGNSISLQCGSNEARFWDFQRGSKQQKKAYSHFTKSIIYVPRAEFLLESEDDAGTMARHELFNADAKMSFSFDKIDIIDVDDIKILIHEYNTTYIKGEEWGGGPVNKEFIKYWKKFILDKVNKNFYNNNPWKPAISLIIETPDYGELKIGFSLITEKAVSIDWGGIKIDTPTTYDESVIIKLREYASEKIYQQGLTINETIELLRLNVVNYFKWEWDGQIFANRFGTI